MNTIRDAPILFSLDRDIYPEVVVHGLIGCQHGADLISPQDESSIIFPMRSALKPWQLLAALGTPSEESDLLACASHSGQPFQLAMLDALATRLKVKFSQLLCPSTFPMDANENARLQVSGAAKSAIFHPCSGKHLAYLSAHRKLGGNPSTYCSEDSPVHHRLVHLLKAAEINDLHWMADSCGLPTLGTSIASVLKLYSSLSDQSEGRKLIELWSKNPRVVGGDARLDTWISQESNGSLIAKEGADGILCVRNTDPANPGVILVKLATGYHSTHLAVGLKIALNRYADVLGGCWQAIREPLNQRIHSELSKDQKLVLQ